MGLDVLSLSGGAPCPPVWDENSSTIIVGPRMGLMTLTLAVFLSLTFGWFSTNPGLLLVRVGVSCWGVEILPCSMSEGLFESGFYEDYLCQYPVCHGTMCCLSPQSHRVVTGTHPVHFQCYLLFVSCSQGVCLGHLAAQGTLDLLLPPDLTMAMDGWSLCVP